MRRALPRGLPGAVFSSHPPDLRRDAYARAFAVDPFSNLPLGIPLTIREFLGEEQFRSSPFMTDFMHGLGLQNVLGVDRLSATGLRIRLRATRAIGDNDFDESEKRLFGWLVVHVTTAVDLFLQLDEAMIDKQTFADALTRLAYGAALVDRRGRILSITDKAALLLKRYHLLTKDESGYRLTVHSRKHAPMAAALEDLACAEGDRQAPWPMSIQDDEGQWLSLILRRTEIRTRLDRPLEATALLTISESSAPLTPDVDTLAQLYGLTPAEAELTAVLGEGLDLSLASQRLDISKNTAKAHLRMIFSKTGVTRQSSLVRLVLRSVDEFVPSATEALLRKDHRPPQRASKLTLK